MTAALSEHIGKDLDNCSIAIATVRVLAGETSHHLVNEDGHIQVSVVTVKGAVPLWPLLALGDKDGTGVWQIPAPGTEVVVAFDHGDFEGEAYLIATRGAPPVGLVPGKVFVVGSEVRVLSDLIKLVSALAAEKIVRGTTYRTSEDVFINAMNVLMTALGVFAGTCTTAPPTTPAATLNTAIGVFQTALGVFTGGASGYLSDKVLIE